MINHVKIWYALLKKKSSENIWSSSLSVAWVVDKSIDYTYEKKEKKRIIEIRIAQTFKYAIEE